MMPQPPGGIVTNLADFSFLLQCLVRKYNMVRSAWDICEPDSGEKHQLLMLEEDSTLSNSIPTPVSGAAAADRFQLQEAGPLCWMDLQRVQPGPSIDNVTRSRSFVAANYIIRELDIQIKSQNKPYNAWPRSYVDELQRKARTLQWDIDCNFNWLAIIHSNQSKT